VIDRDAIAIDVPIVVKFYFKVFSRCSNGSNQVIIPVFNNVWFGSAFSTGGGGNFSGTSF
jgi:hypothetical protein